MTTASHETRAKTSFVVAGLAGIDSYKLTTGLVVPRPIGWVGTRSLNGVANLAPFSFFNAVSGDPPIFVFSPAKSSRRDTLENVRDTGEFSLNIVTADLVVAMNASAASVNSDVDEFDLAGVTPAPGTATAAPMVAECKANIECKVVEIVELGPHGTGHALVIGEGLVFHVDPLLLEGTRVDQAALQAVGRHVGNYYSHGTDLFELARPT